MFIWLETIQGALLIGLILNLLIGDPLPMFSVADLLTGLLPLPQIGFNARAATPQIKIGLWLRLILIASAGSLLTYQLLFLSAFVNPWLNLAFKVLLGWQFLSARQRLIYLKKAEISFYQTGTALALNYLSKTTERLIDASEMKACYQFALRRSIRLIATRWVMPLLCMLSGQWILLAFLRLWDQCYERLNLHSVIYEWLILLPQIIVQGLMRFFLYWLKVDPDDRQVITERYLGFQLPTMNQLASANVTSASDQDQAAAANPDKGQQAPDAQGSENGLPQPETAKEAIDLRDLRYVRASLQASVMLFTLVYCLILIRQIFR